MSEWKARRFWKNAEVAQIDGGWTTTLDGRRIMTPGKSPLILPSRAMAEAVAAEWQAQGEKVDPTTMPVTRAANSAIEKVATQFDAVADMIAEYGGSDLLCYRAERPEGLVMRQAEAWDPLLDWAAETLGAHLLTTQGVMPVAQPPEAMDILTREVHRQTPFELTALSDLVSISGSLVIGLAAQRDWAPSETLFDLSRIDEHWQAEQWGHDEDAAAAEAIKRADFSAAKDFYEMSQADS